MCTGAQAEVSRALPRRFRQTDIMRVLGFSKMWPKLSNQTFTTFRFPRKDKRDWEIGEVVQVVFKPRSPEREILGSAEITCKQVVLIGDITDVEAQIDGFRCSADMFEWLYRTYRLPELALRWMNKLTLRWE